MQRLGNTAATRLDYSQIGCCAAIMMLQNVHEENGGTPKRSEEKEEGLEC